MLPVLTGIMHVFEVATKDKITIVRGSYRNYKGKDNEYKSEYVWLKLNCYGFNAKFSDKLQKGDSVLFSGQLEANSWESNGKNGVNLEVDNCTVGYAGYAGGKKENNQSGQNRSEPDSQSQPIMPPPEDSLPF